jgi:hypothetical protein
MPTFHYDHVFSSKYQMVQKMSLMTSIVPSYHEKVGLLMQMVKLGLVVATKRR